MRAILALLALAPACGGDECTVDKTYQPAIDPAQFVADVTNPLYPLVVGTQYVYMAPDERVEVTVTSDRRTLMGVSTVAVRDTGSNPSSGQVIEDTIDYFAQDQAGNVWYFGEDTKEYENGKVVSTEGTWYAGIDGALPGIIIPAAAVPGSPYRQEYSPCNAEDMGQVLAVNQTVTVPMGTFTGCVQTVDTTPLEPDVEEQKYYCPGVGLTLTIDVSGGGAREELTQKTP